MSEQAEQTLHFKIARALANYARCIDDDRLEEWPAFFVEDCLYKVTTADMHRDGLEAGLIFANSRGMLTDRISALREANVYEKQAYRHIFGPPSILSSGREGVRTRNILHGGPHHARRNDIALCDGALSRRLARRRRRPASEGTHRRVQFIAHRHAHGDPAVSGAGKIIAVAIGDPNGIGPEIAVKAAAQLAQGDGPRALLAGDPYVIAHYAAMVAPGLPLVEGDEPVRGALTFHAVESLPRDAFAPGRIEAAAGKAMTEYVAGAMQLVREGKAYAIVGCPHNETAVHQAGIPFSGYPSLIARLSNTPEDSVFMMFIGGGLRIVHATLHERLADGLARLSTDLVVAAAMAANLRCSAWALRARRSACSASIRTLAKTASSATTTSASTFPPPRACANLAST